MQKFSWYWILVCFLVQLRFNEVSSAVSLCRTKLTGNSGTFTSPHFPNEDSSTEGLEGFYSTRQNQKTKIIRCQWEIEVEAGKGIQLNFGDFNIEGPPDECDKGEVDVFTGTGKQKRRLDKYCAGNNPDTVTSLNNTVTVVFRRPPGFKGKGFLISYIAVEPGETIGDFVTCSDTGKKHVQVESYSVTCPSGCANITTHLVIGNLPYREDSPICRAAVHAGVISDDFGGRIIVRREMGKALYIGSTANNVSANTGPMGDFQINFPAAEICRDQIKLAAEQFSASSYLKETDFYGTIKTWLPRGALLSSATGAWFPGVINKPQWLQVDFKRIMNITGIITKGSSSPYTYTKTYYIKYSYNNITWHPYKEEDHLITKVFRGNTNSFSEVRNNFIRPTIKARYIRVFPNLVDENLPKQGLKVGFTGCEITQPVDIDDILPPPPPPPENPSTPTSTPTPIPTSVLSTTQTFPSLTTTITVAKNTTTKDSKIATKDNIIVTNSTALKENKTIVIPNIDETVDKTPPGGNGSDLSERSIIIIGIVAALAVTSIMLATLVLVLVRKRKKEPKHDTMIPKLTSQSNVTYHAAVGMPYAPNNNNQERKKSKKTRKTQNGICIENTPINGISIENSFARGDPTLPYDQQRQPLVNKQKQNGGNYNVPYSKTATTPFPEPLKNQSQEETSCILTSDDEDHEYQVILDPVNKGDQFTISSKSSSHGSSLGAQSKNSDSGPWQQGVVWGKAVNGWKKEATPDKRYFSSFGSSSETHSPPLKHSGSFSRQDHLSVNKESPSSYPIPTPESASEKNKRSSPKQYLRANSREQSGQNSSFSLAPPYQRFSSSSTGSSAHSRSDGSSGHWKAPYYSSIPKEKQNNSTNRDSEFIIKSSSPKQHHPGSVPHSHLSSNNEFYPPVFFPTSNGVIQAKNDSHFSNGTVRPKDTVDRIDSSLLSRHQQRSDYDQLYRKKSPSEESKSLVAMTTNNYDQLNLNTAV